MPQMTGVEVLTAVRTLSPRTVRILLTGYADLDAVEGSINESEVFRFLTKPCAPDQLRDTIELAATVARETPATNTDSRNSGEITNIGVPISATDDSDSTGAPTVNSHTRLSVDSSPSASTEEVHATTTILDQAPTTQPDAIAAESDVQKQIGRTGYGVVVFTDDDSVLEAVQQAARGRVPIYHARNIVKVIKVLTEHRPGVLLTDISEDKTTIQTMTAQLKEHIPELVTIAISEHRDVLDMVWLINHGQIFRFLRKPLSPGRCAISMQSALQHHRMLLRNPDLVKRHGVEELEATSFVGGVLEKLRSVRELWVSS